MELSKLNENLNIHQSLPDNPTLTADELKKKFDEPATIIKNFLNDIFIPDLEEQIPFEVENKFKTLQGILDSFKAEIETNLSTYKTEMETLISSSKETMTSYSDFAITSNQIALSTDIQYGRATNRKTFTKTGYKPLGIIGFSVSYDYNEKWTIEEYSIEKSTNGSATVLVVGNPTTNKGNIDYNTTVTLQILWLKVK